MCNRKGPTSWITHWGTVSISSQHPWYSMWLWLWPHKYNLELQLLNSAAFFPWGKWILTRVFLYVGFTAYNWTHSAFNQSILACDVCFKKSLIFFFQGRILDSSMFEKLTRSPNHNLIRKPSCNKITSLFLIALENLRDSSPLESKAYQLEILF